MYAQQQQQQQQQQNQHYHQPSTTSSMTTTTTTSTGMVWNGNSWTPTNTTSNSSSGVINRVQQYTDQYHGWEKRKKELEGQLRAALTSPRHRNASNEHQRSALENQIQWAQHYSDESSRAAHHYYNHPNGPPPPFELPPPPPPPSPPPQPPAPALAPAGSNNININNIQKNSNDQPSGSLTRFVKRCLEQCPTDAAKKVVQAKVEQVIASAIQDGTLSSKNWDLVPLVGVGSDDNENESVVGGGSGGGGGGFAHQMEQPAQALQVQQQLQLQQHHHQRKNFPSYGNASAGQQQNSKSVGGSGNSHLYYPNFQQQQQQQPQQQQARQERRNRWGQKSPASGGSHEAVGPSFLETTSGSYYGPSSSSPSSSCNSSSPYSFSQSNKISSSNNKNKRSFHSGDQEDFVVLPHSSSGGNNNNSNKKNKYKKPKHSNGYSLVNTSNVQGMDASDATLAKRANRFAGPGGNNTDDRDGNTVALVVGQYDRFMGKSVIGGTDVTLNETDYEHMTVKGTCTVLEKEYLRLTAPPLSERVRPLAILEQHVRNLKLEYYGEKYSPDDETKPKTEPEDKNSGTTRQKKHDYLWFCSQFKAVRQDCTVQRIQGEFAIEVYETHARIALREGDLNEYNQCQTQLKELYKHCCKDDNKKKSSDTLPLADQKYLFEYQPHQQEFIAYRLLYYIYLSTNEKFSGGSGDMLYILLSLTLSQRSDPPISHALQVREAVALGDYLLFFRLHKKSPNLGRHLTNLLVPTMRLRALRRIAKAYRPSLALNVCLKHLGFLSNATDKKEDEEVPNFDTAEGKEWMVSCGCIIEGSTFVTKDSEIHEPTAATKNSLI